MQISPQPTLGFIGQGFVGKNYADSFEDRGFQTVRYSNEAAYEKNKEAIQECDIVFIAVPTPTTPHGVDDSSVRAVVSLVGKGKIAVIKSTITPGTTESLQEENPDIYILHNPEFLREAKARHDVEHPIRTILGMGADTPEHRAKAELVMSILPKAPFERITDGKTAEFIKYTHNTFGYSLIIFTNLLYELASAQGIDWEPIKESIQANPWIPEMYINPVHNGGRGAGGDCFIKDFAAFSDMYAALVHDPEGEAVLRAYEDKNIQLLVDSNKSVELLTEVYGAKRISHTS